MKNIGEDINVAAQMSSDKKVTGRRGERGSAGGVDAKAEPKYEDSGRMREFYEYCRRIIAAQYVIWRENGKLRG